jgi:hypothetical protein
MSRKKKPELVVDEKGRAWDPDDFFLDSHGVEAPIREQLEMLAGEPGVFSRLTECQAVRANARTMKCEQGRSGARDGEALRWGAGPRI